VFINYFLASKNTLKNVNWKSKKCTNISKTKKSRKSTAAILKATEQPIATKKLTTDKSKKNNLSVDTELLARHNKTIVRKTDMKKPVIVNEDSRGPSTKNADACSVDEEVIRYDEQSIRSKILAHVNKNTFISNNHFGPLAVDDEPDSSSIILNPEDDTKNREYICELICSPINI
jgi:hypothetical protein